MCDRIGKVVDVFTSNKISQLGKRFGFIRFVDVSDSELMIRNLREIWFGYYKLFASSPRFSKPPNPHTKGGNSREKRKRVCLIKGMDFHTLPNLRMLCFDEGFEDFDIRYVESPWVMIEFKHKEACKKFLASDVMNHWILEKRSWDRNFVPTDHLIWVDLEVKEASGWTSSFVWENNKFGSEKLSDQGKFLEDRDVNSHGDTKEGSYDQFRIYETVEKMKEDGRIDKEKILDVYEDDSLVNGGNNVNTHEKGHFWNSFEKKVLKFSSPIFVSNKVAAIVPAEEAFSAAAPAPSATLVTDTAPVYPLGFSSWNNLDGFSENSYNKGTFLSEIQKNIRYWEGHGIQIRRVL
ncbi:unnamed protein product [Lactuca saligna]|uniref:RRM domain-containing protein n=1 Tax=Lactuca saligna TaxID=75948 RepID=A0AA35YMU4_LACSI|nr:unnamed protein product [Lactuca saligna]